MADGGVLTGPEIRKQVATGNIIIDPYRAENVVDDVDDPCNPGSYDLRLGSKVAVYKSCVELGYSAGVSPNTAHFVQQTQGRTLQANPHGKLDSRVAQEVHEFEMDSVVGWCLKPGIGYLMHTVERVLTDKFVPVLDGKSSIGRLFIAVHVTAGYGDTGFDGQYTLEVVATHPVIVYPGMRFCQIRFHTAVGEIVDYKKRGNYTGKASMGPVPSRAWAQFK